MKKLLFTLFVYAIVVVISSCGGSKTQDDHSGVHTHEDGTVHGEDHSQEDKAIVEQESFDVDADATEAHDHSGTHTHADGTVHEGESHDAATKEDADHDHDDDHKH